MKREHNGLSPYDCDECDRVAGIHLVVAGIILAILVSVVLVFGAEPEKPPELTLQALIDARNVVVKELNESFQRFKKLEATFSQLDAEIARRQKDETKAGETK